MPVPSNQGMLFASQAAQQAPLAERLRPHRLEDVIGHEALLAPDAPLGRLVAEGRLVSMLFWGPPGCGKTTLARLLAGCIEARFVELSAVASGVAELREALAEARKLQEAVGQQTVLFIDEIHRYSKTQQDGLLHAVERGHVTLIGATTENPSFQVIPALRSRMLIFQLTPLSAEGIDRVVRRGAQTLGVSLAEAAQQYLVHYANGDARSVLNLLETAVLLMPDKTTPVGVEALESLAQQARLNYDEDTHYDLASAYQKSLRGSDADAAVYYLARLLSAGEDPRFVARRLLVTASEDVGNADPMALLLARAAFDAVERLGMPECRLALAQATIYVAQAPKSNQSIMAVDAAMADIQQGKAYPVPMHLRDSHYRDAKERYGHGVGYLYSHQHPQVPQRFLPEGLDAPGYVQPIQPVRSRKGAPDAQAEAP